MEAYPNLKPWKPGHVKGGSVVHRLIGPLHHIGNQPPINRRKQKKLLLSQPNMWMAGCGHLVSRATQMADLGSRTVFSQGFLKDLASVWASYGRAAMEKTAIDQPGVFLATRRQTDRPRGQT